MPSFDISSEVNWQELDNAIHHALKEVATRFDFKNVKCELNLDRKAKTVTIWCSNPGKFDALKEIYENKALKRGLSLLSFDYQKREDAFGGSSRQVVIIQAGISKEKGKEVVAAIKDSKLKVQAQIQDEQVRVSGKNRDDLQACIAYVRGKQDQLKLPLQFGNFRD